MWVPRPRRAVDTTTPPQPHDALPFNDTRPAETFLQYQLEPPFLVYSRQDGSSILRWRQLQNVGPGSTGLSWMSGTDKLPGTATPSRSKRLSRTSTMPSSTPTRVRYKTALQHKAGQSLPSAKYHAHAHHPRSEVVIAPPAPYLSLTRQVTRKGIEVAAQNVHDKPSGAFTGETSAEALKDLGITWTLIGHSERRVVLKEDDEFVASKTKAALDAGLSVVLCCGESLEQREKGETVSHVTSQLKAVADKVKDWSKVVIAYEPIW